jgi:UDP:flavonoid glycosyltransferase YjiC (YdhE family)
LDVVRVLFASTAGAGHVGPLVPFALACARAGHEVLVAAPGSAAVQVRRFGLPFVPVGEPPAAEREAAWAPVWAPETAPGAAHVIQELFVGLQARAALPEMLEVVGAWRPDLVVRESCEFAALLAAERFEVPQAQIGIHLASETDTDDWLVDLAAPALDALRAEAGLAPDPAASVARSVPVFTCSPRSLAGADSPRVRRIRAADTALAEPLPAAAEPPPAWDPERPLVYVSFGSEAPRAHWFPRLYRAAVDALADLPAHVLLTIGDERDPAELGPLPPSVRVESWVSQAAVMPKAAAIVGHGGSGSTLIALAAGVPVALVPLFVDGPENARRVAAAGAGVALEPGLAGAAELGGAVAALLRDPRYRIGAAAAAAEIRALPPVDEAVADLMALSRPVARSG